MALVIALAGGGTAGHLFPALALAAAIRKRDPDADVRFLGSERGVGPARVRAAGYRFDSVPTRPVVGRGPVRAARALVTLARGALRARGLLRRAGADLVIGCGGYASVPGVLAAATLGVPAVLLEPDAAPGRANRLLGRLARRVFVQFDDACSHFPPGRALRLGFPVREIPPHVDAAAGAPVRLLVFGGSQGAHAINRAMMRSLPSLRGLEITHQTGELDLEAVSAAYVEAGIEARVAPFFDDLPERLARTDLLVARAGASTVAELCRAGVAAVLVPLELAGAHQRRNAAALERAGACRVIPEGEADARLGAALDELALDPARRSALAEAAAGLASPGAAERIWEACRPLALRRAR